MKNIRTDVNIDGELTVDGGAVSAIPTSINAQTGTAYTLALSDAGKLVTLDNAAAVTVTVPPESSVAFPVGSRVMLAQIGAGVVTIAAGAGVTVNADPGLVLAAQYAGAELFKVGADSWLAVGGLA